MSVVVVLVTNVVSLLMSAIMVGAVVVCAHGVMRMPEDLFLNDQETGGAATRFLSFGGATSSGVAVVDLAVTGCVGSRSDVLQSDFTIEQDNITHPTVGSHYAATKAIIYLHAKFYDIIRERSLQAMNHFWLQADYVKCINASGDLFSGPTPDDTFSWLQFKP